MKRFLTVRTQPSALKRSAKDARNYALRPLRFSLCAFAVRINKNQIIKNDGGKPYSHLIFQKNNLSSNELRYNHLYNSLLLRLFCCFDEAKMRFLNPPVINNFKIIKTIEV